MIRDRRKKLPRTGPGTLHTPHIPLPPPCGAIQLFYRLPQRLRALGEFLECGPILVAHQDCLCVNEFYLLLKPAEKM